MKARVATFAQVPEGNSEGLEAFRRILASQEGLVAAYHVKDPQSGEGLSITLWDDDAFDSAQDRIRSQSGGAPPAGMSPPEKVAVYEVEWSVARDAG
jgi:hypothetical protein